MTVLQNTTITSNGIFKFRKKTPKALQQYTKKREIVKSLGKNPTDATKKALEITQVIEEALQLTQLSSVPDKVIYDLLETHNLVATKSTNRQPKKDHSITWEELTRLYLDQSNVTDQEFSAREYFFCKLMPSVLKVVIKTANPQLSKLTYDVQLEIRKLLAKAPKKNIHRYRSMEPYELFTKIKEGSLQINSSETMAVNTINKNLKRIKSLLLFGQNSGYFNGVIPNLTIESKTLARGQRKEFTTDDIKKLDLVIQEESIYPIYKILRYTGMRLSELLKCTLNKIDGVLCFDLRDPKSPLKTISSHRVIPVHHELNDAIDSYYEVINSYSDKYVSKRFKKIQNKVLNDPEGKSLYSLRHTFATQLIAKGVQPEIVSELMGHAHSTMTMNRYVKGYPVEVLKRAVDTL